MLGAAAMSFAQLVIDRVGPGAVGLLTGSRCPRCGTRLRSRDVLPVAGFLLLHGRCAGCAGRIPRRHLAGELGAAAFWAIALVVAGPVWWLPVALVAPVTAVLSASLRGAGRRALTAGLLPPLGLALLTLGLAGAVQGRWGLYGAAGGLGTASLLAAVLAARGKPAALEASAHRR